MANRLLEAFKKFQTKDGTQALDGGYLYFYESGTLTPKATYSDATELIANTNPLILTSEGWPRDVFAGGSFKIRSYDGDKDNGGVLQQEFDPVGAIINFAPFDTWSEDVIYGAYGTNIVVSSVDGKYYRSRIASNNNFEPSVSPTQWERFYLGLYDWSIEAMPYTTLGWTEEYIEADTTLSAGTLTLKTGPTDGMVVGVHDQKGQFGTNNLTVEDADGNNIGNSATDFICDLTNLTVFFSFDATAGNWRVY